MAGPSTAVLASGPDLAHPVELHPPEEAAAEQPWYARLARPETAREMRAVGQRILGVMVQYISQPEEERRLLGEAREIGGTYGVLAAKAGASLAGADQTANRDRVHQPPFPRP